MSDTTIDLRPEETTGTGRGWFYCGSCDARIEVDLDVEVRMTCECGAELLVRLLGPVDPKHVCTIRDTIVEIDGKSHKIGEHCSNTAPGCPHRKAKMEERVRRAEERLTERAERIRNLDEGIRNAIRDCIREGMSPERIRKAASGLTPNPASVEAILDEELAKVKRRCWCGGEIGPREPGDADGLGCLDDIFHASADLDDMTLTRVEDETWQTCDEVPEGVPYTDYKDTEVVNGFWVNRSEGRRCINVDGTEVDSGLSAETMNRLAPFVRVVVKR